MDTVLKIIKGRRTMVTFTTSSTHPYTTKNDKDNTTKIPTEATIESNMGVLAFGSTDLIAFIP